MFRFSESDYSRGEQDLLIPITLIRTTRIATPVTMRIVPMNYTHFLQSGLPISPEFPEVSPFDPARPNRANSNG